jgi:hypothetical protein
LSARLAKACRRGFSRSVDGAPVLLPSSDSTFRRALNEWFDARNIRPEVIAELDDAALASVFGEAGLGVFAAPEAIPVRRGARDVRCTAPRVDERLGGVPPEPTDRLLKERGNLLTFAARIDKADGPMFACLHRASCDVRWKHASCPDAREHVGDVAWRRFDRTKHLRHLLLPAVVCVIRSRSRPLVECEQFIEASRPQHRQYEGRTREPIAFVESWWDDLGSDEVEPGAPLGEAKAESYRVHAGDLPA